MRIFSALCLVLGMWFSISCTGDGKSSETEQALTQRQQHLDSLETALRAREQQLDTREQEISARERQMDSVSHASRSVYDSTLVGRWNVQMVCTETSCEGSAVGDTKTEHWVIAYQGDSVSLSAMEGERVKRVYTGLYNGTELQATAVRSDSTSALMKVSLHKAKGGQMEGERELVRTPECTVVYSLKLVRN